MVAHYEHVRGILFSKVKIVWEEINSFEGVLH